MRIGKYTIRLHTIDERKHERERDQYLFYMRYFLHVYAWNWGDYERESRSVWDGHLEVPIQKWSHLGGHLFSARFHVGNRGSETPWDGHLFILGMGFYWGHSGFRKLADWVTNCAGYQYDTREWSLKIFSNTLWWEIANHSDMCDLHRPKYRKKRSGKKARYRTWRRGSLNLSIPQLIWGPKLYTHDTIDSFATMLKFKGEGEYAAIIDLQKQYLGRTRVRRDKHAISWYLEVDAPGGIPTHVDHSGGWKGDRTHGFGVNFDYPSVDEESWKVEAEAAVVDWVMNERKRTGFKRPDPVERG